VRRTGLGAAGYPGDAAACAAAEIMGHELGWDTARREQEIADLKRFYAPLSTEQ
jgi:glycerol-3-phosphate dehydrogenase